MEFTYEGMFGTKTHLMKVPLRVVPNRSDFKTDFFEETDVITKSGCYSSSIFSIFKTNGSEVKYNAKLKRTKFANGEKIEITMDIDNKSSLNAIPFDVVLKNHYKMVMNRH